MPRGFGQLARLGGSKAGETRRPPEYNRASRLDHISTSDPRVTTLFLTGATGYVGKRLLALRAPSAGKVLALVRDRSRVPASLRQRSDIEWIEGELNRPETWASRLAECRHVVHLAALTGKARRTDYDRVNAEGTRRLVETARDAGVAGFVHVSSIAAAFPDQTSYWYAHSKVRSEEIVAEAGLPHVIVRPTMILGEGAALLDAFGTLARAPVVPVFGNGQAKVQPVWGDDVARCLLDLVAEERFDGETLELGGPDVVTIEELLFAMRGPRRRRHVVHLPLRPIRGVLGLLEPLLLPVMPLTAGQLATFANEGMAQPHPWLGARRASMAGLATMLASLDGDDGQHRAEGAVLARYLSGKKAPDYVLDKYVAFHDAYPDRLDGFDRRLLRLAQMLPLVLRLGDAYTAQFARGSALRRKLVLMLALLEVTPPACEEFEGPSGSPLGTWFGLGMRAAAEAVCLVLGTLLLGPLHLIAGGKPAVEARS